MQTIQIIGFLLAGMGATLVFFGPYMFPSAPPPAATAAAPEPTDVYEMRFVGRAKNHDPDVIIEDVKIAPMDGDGPSAVSPYRVDGQDFIVLASPEWHSLFEQYHGRRKYLLGFRYHTLVDGHKMAGGHVVMHDPNPVLENAVVRREPDQ